MSSTKPDVAGYIEFLEKRDGDVNESRRTLSVREAYFADIDADPVRSTRRVDRDAFLTNLRRRRPEAALDPQMLWLLGTAKLNQSERFAIALTEAYGTVALDAQHPELVHVALEEQYHTRILADVVAMFGLPMPPVPPPFWMRQFIKLTVFGPDERVVAFIGAAEMAGCVFFALMRDKGCELFADEPRVAERIRSLYDEILIDEIGHVGFCAARTGRTGRALMRRLYPTLGRLIAKQMPELGQVLGAVEIEQRLSTPFDLDDYLADFGGRAFAPAAI